jgi:hypothetical protein
LGADLADVPHRLAQRVPQARDLLSADARRSMVWWTSTRSARTASTLANTVRKFSTSATHDRSGGDFT